MKITEAKLYKQLSTESRELKSSFLKCIYYGAGTCVAKLRCGVQRTMFGVSFAPSMV